MTYIIGWGPFRFVFCDRRKTTPLFEVAGLAVAKPDVLVQKGILLRICELILTGPFDDA